MCHHGGVPTMAVLEALPRRCAGKHLARKDRVGNRLLRSWRDNSLGSKIASKPVASAHHRGITMVQLQLSVNKLIEILELQQIDATFVDLRIDGDIAIIDVKSKKLEAGVYKLRY